MADAVDLHSASTAAQKNVAHPTYFPIVKLIQIVLEQSFLNFVPGLVWQLVYHSQYIKRRRSQAQVCQIAWPNWQGFAIYTITNKREVSAKIVSSLSRARSLGNCCEWPQRFGPLSLHLLCANIQHVTTTICCKLAKGFRLRGQ